jgi:hypothetical protein
MSDDGIDFLSQELPLVYNQYVGIVGNPHYKPEDDDKEMVFRPLFLTSFFLDDYLFDNNFFEAKQIIIASASSKTAVSLAYHSNSQTFVRLGTRRHRRKIRGGLAGILKWLDGWYQTEHFKGAQGLKDAYERVLEGKAAPEHGFVVDL